MSAPNDGGPAFPEAGLSGLPNGEFLYGRSGMTLRAYLAAHSPAPADMGLVHARMLTGQAEPDRTSYEDGYTGNREFTLDLARWWAKAEAAYSVMKADALIAALAVKP